MAEQTAGTFTQSPAALAFSTLYARAQNYVLGPSDTEVTTIAKEGINDAIKRLNTRDWNWARTAASITFTAGEGGREYQLATNFKSPRSFELLDSSSRIVGRLGYLDPKSFDLETISRASGDPAYYTVFNPFDNGYLTLSGPPSAGWIAAYPTGRLRYNRRTALLSADADLFAGPSECEPFLVWHARSVLAAHWDPSKFSVAERMAERQWEYLVISDVKSQITDWS